ncbi:hypothetical protein DTO280E4_8641 [Paecilomyces variotii]|nr:hypothetical protein DTO169C6_3326 [Paecilomyces variotii]KAJ9255937.1 hypothetical protein DTO195F2_6141 [Paecilomyces variotii]KAJ9286506.1 hypothetical protein DTO021C3_5854 [Paecilomyces variotii]KAJ9350561.1 hypothetical protein DTO280E4_8641 [Paecilomyces variotii]KAJ9368096.1 hypothetical protein DTO282E5_7212 [Paecilomyces variotii]
MANLLGHQHQLSRDPGISLRDLWFNGSEAATSVATPLTVLKLAGYENLNLGVAKGYNTHEPWGFVGHCDSITIRKTPDGSTISTPSRLLPVKGPSVAVSESEVAKEGDHGNWNMKAPR